LFSHNMAYYMTGLILCLMSGHWRNGRPFVYPIVFLRTGARPLINSDTGAMCGCLDIFIRDFRRQPSRKGDPDPAQTVFRAGRILRTGIPKVTEAKTMAERR
jgi:hypothetical protein